MKPYTWHSDEQGSKSAWRTVLRHWVGNNSLQFSWMWSAEIKCLGDPWCESGSDKEGFKEPPENRRWKELVSKWLIASSSSVEMEKICKGFVPNNMQKATKWAVRVFEEWRAERNKVLSDDGELCPSKVLVGVPYTNVTQLLAVAWFIIE